MASVCPLRPLDCKERQWVLNHCSYLTPCCFKMNESFKTCQFRQQQGWGLGGGPGFDATKCAVRRGGSQLAEPWGGEKGRGGAGPGELPLAAQGAREETHSPQEAHPGPARSSGPRGHPTPRWSSSRKGLGPADPSWVPGLCSNITHHGAHSPGPGLPCPPSSPPGPRPGDTRATGGRGTRHPPRQLSPCSQFLPPKRSGHSHRYVFQPLTQVPPF